MGKGGGREMKEETVIKMERGWSREVEERSQQGGMEMEGDKSEEKRVSEGFTFSAAQVRPARRPRDRSPLCSSLIKMLCLLLLTSCVYSSQISPLVPEPRHSLSFSPPSKGQYHLLDLKFADCSIVYPNRGRGDALWNAPIDFIWISINIPQIVFALVWWWGNLEAGVALKLQKMTFWARNDSYWRLFLLHTPPFLLHATPPGEFGVKTKRQRALLHAVSASGHSKLTIDYYSLTSPSENIV